jgi:hypothetical protein
LLLLNTNDRCPRPLRTRMAQDQRPNLAGHPGFVATAHLRG